MVRAQRITRRLTKRLARRITQLPGSGTSISVPLSLVPAGITLYSGTEVGIQRRGVNGVASIYSQLEGNTYARMRMDDGGRLSWRETDILRLFNVYTHQDFTVSGANSLLSSPNSGRDASYIGSGVQRLLAANAYVEVDVTGSGDLYVVYTGRTSSGIARVDIDGSQTLVDLPTVGSGFRGWDTYNAVDLTRRIPIKVASGLPEATYTVRVTCTGELGSGSQDDIYIEGIAIESDLSGENLDAPEWQPSTAYEIGDEVRTGGYWYACTAGGTSDGVTAPSHTSGTATDGTATWRAWDSSSREFALIEADYPSEREYAFEAEISATTEDIGGATHGGETLVLRSIQVDGENFDLSAVGYTAIESGSRLTIIEAITMDHSQATGNLATASLSRTFTPGKAEHDLTIEWEDSADIGWFYANMMPLIRYWGASEVEVWDDIEYDSGFTYALDTSDGASNDVGNESATAIAATGDLVLADESRNAVWAAATNLQSVDNYAATGADAFTRANVGADDKTGSDDWQLKSYFRRAGSSNKVAVSSGDQWRIRGLHAIGIEP